MLNSYDSLPIAVVDDDDAVRRSIETLLNASQVPTAGFSNGKSFVDAMTTSAFSAAVIDLHMPRMSGLELLEALDPLSFPFLVLSEMGEATSALRAIKLGASDFLEKPFSGADLDKALQKLTPHKAAQPSDKEHDADRRLASLTPREKEVALRMYQGDSNKVVARHIGCSPRTVEVHRSRVFLKLNVRNVVGLVRFMASDDDAA